MKQSDSSEWNKFEEMGSKKGRIYECLCGRKYRTSASYNTHLKINHNGNSPDSFSVEKRRERGRPKQYQYKQFKDELLLTKNPLEELVQFQGKCASSGLNARKLYENQDVFHLINRFCESERDKNLRFMEEDKIYYVTMGEGIAILLQQLRGQVRGDQFYDDLVLLITIYISYVIEETEDQNVLVNGTVGLLPEFANIFILYDLDRRCIRLRVDGSWIGDRLKVMKVLSIIFNWLIYKRFTHTQAIVNNQYPGELEKAVSPTGVAVEPLP